MLRDPPRSLYASALLLLSLLSSACETGAPQSTQQPSAPPSQKTESLTPIPLPETQSTTSVQPQTPEPPPPLQSGQTVTEPVAPLPPPETAIAPPPLDAEQPQIITLVWDPVNDLTVQGYKVHSGTSPREYSTHEDVGNATSFILHVSGGYSWYFAITAYNAAGESPLSQEISTTLP
jgi:hypothetical protein